MRPIINRGVFAVLVLLLSLSTHVATSYGATEVLSDKDHSKPVLTELVRSPGVTGSGFVDIAVKDGWGYILTQKPELEVVDLATPGKIVVTIPLKGQPQRMYYSDGHIYVLDPSVGVHVVDVRVPKNTVYLKLVPVRYVRDIGVDSPYAYLAAEDDGFKSVDVSSKEQSAVKRINGCNFASFLALKRPYVYLACSAEFQIIDISNYDKPRMIGGLQFDSDINGVALDENRAYLAFGSGHVSVLNTQDPKKIIKEARIFADAEYKGTMGFDKKFIYVGSRRGLVIIDKKTLIAKELDMGRRVYRLQVQNGYAYCLDTSVSVFKIKLNTINFEGLPGAPKYVAEGD